MIVISNATQFQWEKKRPKDADFTAINSATQASYQIYPSGGTEHPSGTQYRVRLNESTCLVISEAATITLHTITSIINPSICERGNGRLEAQIPTRQQASNFQWALSINNAPFEDIAESASYAGTQTPNLDIKQVSANMDGYRFKIRMNFTISPNNDNEGSLTNQNQVSSCPRSSNDVSLQVKTSPIPTHPATIYKGCAGESITLNSTGCSPYTTQWYDRNGKTLSQGAKTSVILPDMNPYVYTATCLKLGCESLPSKGTTAQAYTKPSPPTNTGTPDAICSELPLTFKASGGTNNIWYLTANASTPVSTASQIKVNGLTPETTVTRFVSQSINNCESPRTAIHVRIKSSAECAGILPPTEPSDASSSSIPEAPEEPDPVIPSTNKPAEMPILSYQISPNCGLGTYQLKVFGCPNTPEIYNQYGPEKRIALGEFTTIQATSEAYIQIRCPGTIAPPIQVTLPEMLKPEILTETNYSNFACSDDEIKLHAILPPFVEIIGWELNGHLISENLTLSGKLQTGFYQAVVRKNGCIHRGEGTRISIHERPQAPQVFISKNKICLGDTVEINTNESLVKWLSEAPENKKFIGKRIGNYSFVAQTATDGVCWSAPSTPQIIQVLPLPKSPTILSHRDAGFCQGDSTRLQADILSQTYAWNTGDSTQTRYSKTPETTQVKYRDSSGCWSAWSLPINTFHFPSEPQPTISASPSRQFCQGDHIVLHATPAFRYAWNVGGNQDSLMLNHTDKISLRTQNEYGCWSKPSDEMTVVAQQNPSLPILEKMGSYFLSARNIIDKADRYAWKFSQVQLPDTLNQIKMVESGLYEAQAKKDYLLEGSKITCSSKYKAYLYTLPLEMDGLSIYPNPTNSTSLGIEILDKSKQNTIELTDLKGNLMQRWELGSSDIRHRIKLKDSITNGSYILQIQSEEGIKTRIISILK